ncbi:MAG: CpsD/CapB family tyrosine-protein kinase [Bryobacteraceae bacterium]|nr:CpsD/CapB family tyrosine-protein kinase [Bryobacteraceae bacterium]
MRPDLGQIAVEKVEITPEQRLIVLSDPRSPGADRFRYLRMRLRELGAKGQLKSLVVTSPTPQDGKSTVAMNLATVLAESGRRQVLLVEADLHRPSLAKTLAVTALPGLAECLENGLNPLDAIRKIEPLHWYLLQAGNPLGNPTELLQTASLPAVLDTLTSHFDWVIVDTPPMVPLTDALCLSRLVDAVLLVLRAGKTPQDTVHEALGLLGPGKVAGLIFNGAEDLSRLYEKYAGYYGRK